LRQQQAAPPEPSGLGVLQAVMQAHRDLSVVTMTAVPDESVHTVAKRLGAVGVLHKPFGLSDLPTAAHDAKVVRVVPPLVVTG
jgi:FixJ family two-component response regulator